MWTHPRLKAKSGRSRGVRYAHEKMNGHRLTIFKQMSGEVIALSSGDTRVDISHWPWSAPIFTNLPPHSSVDGELVMGRRFNVKTALIERDPMLRFHVFAVPWFRGADCKAMGLEWLDDVCAFVGLTSVPWTPIGSWDYAEIARARKIEGFVLKVANYIGWWKVKPVKTIEVIVTGETDGDGKFLGLVGSIHCSVIHDGCLVEVARVSGMTDQQRLDFDINEDRGRVLEVEYESVGKKRLLLPRFGEWRDDREIAYSSQDPDLVEALS